MVTLKEVSLVAEGEWHGTVTAVKQVAGEKWGDQYELELLLRRKGGVTAEMRAWCSTKYTSGAKSSKLFLWTSALYGGNPPRTFEPLTDLIGKSAIVNVTIEPKASGDGKVNRIGSMRPIRPAAAQPPAPVAPPPPPPSTMTDEEWKRILIDEPAIDDDLIDDVAA